ncbi:MAG: NapC/NirT family cytochrome c [Anaerolineae bacterium]
MVRLSGWLSALPKRRRWGIRFVLLFVVVLIGAGLFMGGLSIWEYTNSPQFCGATCHTMPPEYTAYQISPHARVACVECHLGRDVASVIIGRKAGDAIHVVRLLTKNFEVPIHARSMRPAMDSCEKCHWPEKFSDDSVREIKHFAEDENNTETSTILVMRTGGGTAREGRGYGIHWHIENQVWYIATDELRQEIPWVRVIDQQGRVTDYVDAEADLSRDFIESAPKRRMDCIDCHNRVSHLFRSPERAVDRALVLKQLSKDIPFIKKKGVELLSRSYDTMSEAMATIESLPDYYQANFPDFYAGNTKIIKDAANVLKGIYQQIVFPTMDVSWETHPDNIGHKDWPGCFRCHDGKHLSEEGTSIRLHCNICHSIPANVREGEAAPTVSLSTAGEPASHLATNWMAEHRFAADGVCEQCHGPHEFGSNDSGFCTNSSCHGTKWEWVGLDAAFPHPIELVGKHADLECIKCHGRVHEPKYVCSNCHERPHAFGGDECQECHTPVGWRESAATLVEGTPTISHSLEGRDDCLVCHSTGGLKPFPDGHAGWKNEVCQTCHKAG